LVTLQNIGFHFGGRYLYQDVNWQIYEGQRIGLVGPNGAGKSTLLRLISGDYTPNEGTINKSNDCTIGFLNQDLLSIEYKQSIYEVAVEAFKDALDLEKELNELYLKLETDTSDEVLNRLGIVQEKFEALDGYNVKHKTEQVLEGLGFATKDLSRPFSEFSGGWRMRVLLAKILLKQPRLLLLDEPTNHLDLPSIEWLETYLRDYKGAVIVVSHDKFFLDKMINFTAEVAYGRLTLYPGNYTFFLSSKAEREELQQRQFDNQQQFIKQQERFIERFKAKASKATQAQSRVKQLEKLERIEAVQTADSRINLNFKAARKSGKVLKKFSGLHKSYPSNPILTNAHGELERGDKIALIGANGKGKTTLLRIIAGIESYEGELETGYQVEQSFYAQHQLEALNVNNEILAELDRLGSGKTEAEIRTLLGCFLFTGEDVFKKIKVLSGGEKARVALAKCLIEESNFLLLDEPTNHLDMQSINILIQALNNFDGTVLFVSHDRHFIDEVATKIWWIENQELKEYPGTYQEYLVYMETRKASDKQEDLAQKTIQTQQKNNKPKAEAPVNDNTALTKKLNNLLSNLEAEIKQINKEKEAIESWLADEKNAQKTNEIAQKSSEYSNIQSKLELKNVEYEKTFEQLMELDN